jgi:hypothetical protein
MRSFRTARQFGRNAASCRGAERPEHDAIEGDEELIAELGEHARGGDLEELVVALRLRGRRVGQVEAAQRGPDGGLERGEADELALQREWVARGHRSRSRVSASMTRATTSHSTSGHRVTASVVVDQAQTRWRTAATDSRTTAHSVSAIAIAACP